MLLRDRYDLRALLEKVVEGMDCLYSHIAHVPVFEEPPDVCIVIYNLAVASVAAARTFLLPPQARIEDIAQAIADEVEGHHQAGDC